ncbi:MAG: hypothetical protein IT349_20610 [Candidatus Eisenbacteria bacterium]|nr:hypothetical protein [Candidatus Eisenbacteria bacterium]
MTDELEQDLNGVWMGGLVTVTGVVESTTPAVPCLTPSLPSFVDRTWGYFAGFWRRLAGQPTASFATFPRRTKSPPASPEIAVVTIKPNRVDPAWSLERRYVSAELVALEEEAARLQALEEELREWAEGVVVPAIVCAAFQARDQEVGAAEEERVFKFAQLSQALGEGPVQYGVEWQGIECFASIRTGGEAERRRLGAERFYARSRELVKWRNELAEAAAQLRIAKRDLAVLERSALSLPPVGGRGVTTAAAGRSSSGSPGVSPVGCYGALPTPSGGQQHGEARK